MDALERLTAVEDIRQLLSRRTRLIDEKDWEALVEIYTDDVPGHHTGTTGARALVEYVKKALDGVTSIHQAHLPEIEITSPTTAKAIVPMEDLLLWEADGVKRWAHGYGHYRQSFVKTDRGWLISDHLLTRLYLKEGVGDFEFSNAQGELTARFKQVTGNPR